MKIAVPIDKKDTETNVCESFGRAPYYLIHDTDSGKYEFIDNSAATSTGGAGIKAAQIIVDAEADVLLTPQCGENAANVLRAAGIKIYKTQQGILAKDNIDAFVSGKLSLLDNIHAGFHGHGRRKR